MVAKPNIQQFRRQDLFAAVATRVWNSLPSGLTKSRLIILLVQAVADDIFVWTARPRRIVNSINYAV